MEREKTHTEAKNATMMHKKLSSFKMKKRVKKGSQMGPKMTSKSHQIASREHPEKTTKKRDQKDPVQQTENIGPFGRQGGTWDAPGK